MMSLSFHERVDVMSYGAAAYQRERDVRSGPHLHLAELIRDLSAENASRGRSAEFIEHAAAHFDRAPEYARPSVPIEQLLDGNVGFRDLDTSSGANLIPQPVQSVTDALRPYSTVASAGVETVVATQPGGLQYPLEASTAAAQWLASESSAIGEDQPVLGEYTATPHAAGVYLEISRKLLLQSNADEWLRRTIRRSLADLIDAAVLNGNGLSGQPLGVANVSGIGAIDGASIQIADINAGLKHARANGLDQRECTIIAGADAEEVMRNREIAANSGRFLWSGNQVGGTPAYGTRHCPDDALLLGPWNRIKLVLWGDAVVEVNPYANFQAGITAMRILVGADIVHTQPVAFAYAPTVS